jgi:uncharacterized damage-inducible protein DinB
MPPEINHYLERIEDLRNQLIALVRGLPAEALEWRPIETVEVHATNSLAVLATHAAGAEHFWIAEVIGGYPATRKRSNEFAARAGSADELASILERNGPETRSVLEALSLEELGGEREVNGRIVPVRWAILHVIDHTALHLGHAQITYQLWQGGTGYDAPRWCQRVPPGSRQD